MDKSEKVLNGMKTKEMEPCAICKTDTDKFCSACKKVYYCSVEHQKSHRKVHKKDCYPAVLKENSQFGGRCFIASRAIKQGELIFTDKSLVTGPSGAENYFHCICLGCYRQVKGEGSKMYKCSTCGWPMCSKQCEDNVQHSQFECRIFSSNKIQPYFTKPVQYELINTLRSLLLMLIEPEKWKELAQLESHSKERAKNPASVRAVKEHVNFIHSVCNLTVQFETELIDHVVGVWGINSFGANPPAGPSPGRARMATLMFPRLCLAAHSCLPNTRGILLEDLTAKRPTYSMELIASIPIQEGEQIHTTYANVNEGTFERQAILRENYYFACKCSRCVDPTEFETFFSAFKCPDCSPGYLLPSNPLNPESLWTCVNTNKCKGSGSGSGFSYSELKIKLNKIKRELHNIPNEPSLSTIQQLENILYKNQRKTLHTNHWFMIEVEFLLCMKILGYLPKCQKSEEEELLLNRLNEICEHCLYIADLIQPGHISYRGKLLYCLAQAKMKLLVNGTKSKGVETILQGKEILDQIQGYAREAMSILSREPEGTEDYSLSQRLAKDLIQVKTMLDFVNMKI